MVAVDGVKPGETVVVEGKQNVRDGGKVRTESAAPRPRNGSTDGASAASLSPAESAGAKGREPT
jgi:multidrug efflux system membrane fusion protein